MASTDIEFDFFEVADVGADIALDDFIWFDQADGQIHAEATSSAYKRYIGQTV